jgi:NAD(P)H-hydrate epimerase
MQSLKEFSTYTKKVLGARDTFAVRENAIALGIDEKVLVENAGYAICSQLKRTYKDEKILFICGTGGKGAIGLSSARHILPYAQVRVAFLGNPEHIHRDSTKFNYNILEDMMDIEIIGPDDLPKLREMLKWAHHVVDAVLGVGVKGRLSGFAIGIVKEVNDGSRHTISIDVPTGIDPDTGAQNMASIKADQIFTLYKPKAGIQKSKLMKNVNLIDIGMPLSAELFSGPGDVRIATEPRLLQSNKYTHGNVLIVGGSGDYKGAPVLAARAAHNAFAALRTGAGYVTIATEKQIAGMISAPNPGLIVRGINGGDLLEKDIPMLNSIKHDVLVIGMGMEPTEPVLKAIAKLAAAETKNKNRVLLDAAAIMALKLYKNMLGRNMILTPHDGEFKALTGINLKNCTFEERVRKAIHFANDRSCTLVLKGHDTIVTNGDLLKINRSKTAALATMGSGDVLSGIIGSYASFHEDPFESAVAGVHVHSKIADLLFLQKGGHIIAQDIIDAIPDMLKVFDYKT